MAPGGPRKQEKMLAVSFDLQPMSISQMGVVGETWGKLERKKSKITPALNYLA